MSPKCSRKHPSHAAVSCCKLAGHTGCHLGWRPARANGEPAEGARAVRWKDTDYRLGVWSRREDKTT